MTGIAVSKKKHEQRKQGRIPSCSRWGLYEVSPQKCLSVYTSNLKFFPRYHRISTVGNFLIFAALRKVSSIRPHSKLLFRCLTTTDLLADVSSQPLFAVVLISVARRAFQVCYTIMSFNDVIGKSLAAVSLWTLTAISVDRLLALKLGLKCKRVVTLRRTQGLLIFFGFLASLFPVYTVF